RFLAEPDSWQQTATLGLLKPDAYALVASVTVEDAWWIEVDQGTESLTTLAAKLRVYLDAAQAGHLGPEGVFRACWWPWPTRPGVMPLTTSSPDCPPQPTPCCTSRPRTTPSRSCSPSST